MGLYQDAICVQKATDEIKQWLIWIVPLTLLSIQPAKKAVEDEIWFQAKMAPAMHSDVLICFKLTMSLSLVYVLTCFLIIFCSTKNPNWPLPTFHLIIIINIK